MTARKGPPRRLVLAAEGRRTAQAVADLIALGESPEQLAVDLARGHYLDAVTRRDARVLDELQQLDWLDDSVLVAWAARWRFGAWAVAWARETIRLSRARYWCPPNEDGEGALVDETAAVSAPSASELARAAPLIEPHHFDWLAAYQCGLSYHAIATAYPLRVDWRSVRAACRRVAAMMGVPLRSAGHGGRPRRA